MLKKHQDVPYELPWTSIRVGRDRFRAPEIRFQPTLTGHDRLGVSAMLIDALNGVEEAPRAMMLENIVASGGNALLEGFSTPMAHPTPHI
mmetsp:Transcript_27494/g.59680  ORF Transcript_27494/g.59680 Transcript_27494/m.59680 type:complete len:90 (-) Transcript_27494:52-321(-)